MAMNYPIWTKLKSPTDRYNTFCSFSFYHFNVYHSSNYNFRLSLWHFQAFLMKCRAINTTPKCNIYRLIHGHFHIGLVIIPRHPYWPETKSKANMGRGMITRPIWKCPCIKLFITYFRHLEKRHPYWLETPILARADMEMIL